jgi:uncharacterized protein YecT (DUF1311 family)
MFLPHFIVSAIKGLTAFFPWPWNAPFTVALATAFWMAVLWAIRYGAGLADFEYADGARVAGRAPDDRQRLAGDILEYGLRVLVPVLWAGVAVTLLWTPIAAYTSSSASAPAWLRGTVSFWAAVASPYLYPGETPDVPAVPSPSAPAPLSAAPASQGPSFACAYANKWAEQQVCGSAELAADDLQMANLYRAQILPLPRGAARLPLRNAQRAWLATRDRCQIDSDPMQCLRNVYASRIAELSNATLSYH